jgi:hypothetical protein
MIQKEAAVARELQRPNPDFAKLDTLIQALPPGSNRTFYEEQIVKKQTALGRRPIEQVKAEEQRKIVQQSIAKEQEPARKQARSEFNKILDELEQKVAEQETLIARSADPELFYKARFEIVPIAGVKPKELYDEMIQSSDTDPTAIKTREEDKTRWAVITKRGNNLRWKLLDKAQKAVDDLTAYVAKHPGASDATFQELDRKAAQELSNLYKKIVTKIADMGVQAGQAPIELFEVLLKIGDPEGAPGELATAYAAANNGMPIMLPDMPVEIAKISKPGFEYLRRNVKTTITDQPVPKKKKTVTFKDAPEIKTFKQDEPVSPEKVAPKKTSFPREDLSGVKKHQ